MWQRIDPSFTEVSLVPIRKGLVGLTFAVGFALAGRVAAMPSSYAREHPAWCTANRQTDQFARTQCTDRRWCCAHWNDDRTTRIACDPYLSKADKRLPSPNVSVASLAASRDINVSEDISDCLGLSTNIFSFGCGLMGRPRPGGLAEDDNPSMTPTGMKSARLALRAHVSLGPFPITVIKIGIASGGSGLMSVTANANGNGRRTRVVRLTSNEIDHLIAALNASQFWRLPAEPRHQGPADGKLASVEVSIPGLKHHVPDSIGDSDAVDLSILVNALSVIVARHWHDVPGA
jgi:hypothetical protein